MRARSATAGEMAMPTEDEPQAADRLPRTMHRLFSHDLPNQVVAMQSLLQMLELDTGARLGAEGRAYVGRLERVSRKIGVIARFLKEVDRLKTVACRIEDVSLADLVRAVKLPLQQQLPDAPIDYVVDGELSFVTAEPRLLAQALVEVLQCLIERVPARPGRVRLGVRPADDGFALCGEVTWADEPARRIGESPRPSLDQRLEIILARELLGAWGARLAELREAPDAITFCIIVPKRSAHG